MEPAEKAAREVFESRIGPIRKESADIFVTRLNMSTLREIDNPQAKMDIYDYFNGMDPQEACTYVDTLNKQEPGSFHHYLRGIAGMRRESFKSDISTPALSPTSPTSAKSGSFELATYDSAVSRLQKAASAQGKDSVKDALLVCIAEATGLPEHDRGREGTHLWAALGGESTHNLGSVGDENIAEKYQKLSATAKEEFRLPDILEYRALVSTGLLSRSAQKKAALDASGKITGYQNFHAGSTTASHVSRDVVEAIVGMEQSVEHHFSSQTETTQKNRWLSWSRSAAKPDSQEVLVNQRIEIIKKDIESSAQSWGELKGTSGDLIGDDNVFRRPGGKWVSVSRESVPESLPTPGWKDRYGEENPLLQHKYFWLPGSDHAPGHWWSQNTASRSAGAEHGTSPLQIQIDPSVTKTLAAPLVESPLPSEVTRPNLPSRPPDEAFQKTEEDRQYEATYKTAYEGLSPELLSEIQSGIPVPPPPAAPRGTPLPLEATPPKLPSRPPNEAFQETPEDSEYKRIYSAGLSPGLLSEIQSGIPVTPPPAEPRGTPLPLEATPPKLPSRPPYKAFQETPEDSEYKRIYSAGLSPGLLSDIQGGIPAAAPRKAFQSGSQSVPPPPSSPQPRGTAAPGKPRPLPTPPTR